MEFKHTIIEDLTTALAFIALYIVFLMLAKVFKNIFTPYQLNEELTKKDNLSVALTTCGYFLGATAVFVGALTGPSYGLYQDLTLVGGYSILGLLFLSISQRINDKIILSKFCNINELEKRENAAVGAVQCGTYIATGLIAAGAVSGSGGGIATAIIFFALGQLSLFIFTLIYNKFTPYSIHDELEKKNVAAGAALGGTLIALGIIVLNGVARDFISWDASITRVLIVNVMAFIFLPLVRIIMDKIIIPNDELSKEITEDKNLGAGLLEASIAISFAIVLTVLL